MTNYAFPVIVSDLAITSTDESVPIVIPIINRPYHPSDFPYGRAPVEFSVKTVIIKDKLVVGFIGNVSQIVKMKGDIQDYFMHREVTLETMQALFTDTDLKEKYDRADAIFIFTYVEDEKKMVQVIKTGDWLKNEDATCEVIISGGTGRYKWEKFFLEQAKYLDNGPMVNPTNGLEKALITAMYFLSEQFESPDTLQDGWGGGFDIIYLKDDVFKRLDNVSYIFWKVDKLREQFNLTPISILRCSYLNGKFYIQHFNGVNKVYPIAEVGIDEHASEMQDIFHYSTRIAVSCIYLYEGTERKSRLFSINHSHNEQPIVFSQVVDGKLAFAFATSFQDELMKAMMGQ